MATDPQKLIALLVDSGILGAADLVTDAGALFAYRADAFTLAVGTPAAVAFPRDTAQAARVVRALGDAGVTLVCRGSGTGLAGGSAPLAAGDGGAVLVCTARMTRVFSVDVANRVAHAQAGVRNSALTDAVNRVPGGAGLHFAPDPSSQKAATLGGTAATNAGGVHTLKDFVTSNHVLGLTAVLPDGRVLECGAGGGAYEPGPFDLTALLCGSEGTLGLITELWVRLVPRRTLFRTLLAVFADPAAAAEAVSDVIAAGVLPAALEMMDGAMVRAVEDAFALGFPRDAAALLLTELDAPADAAASLEAEVATVREIMLRHGAAPVKTGSDPFERAALWKGRKGAFGAIGRISRSYCTQDACVPRSRLADVLARTADIAARHATPIHNVFHAGDGNIHPIFLFDERDAGQVARALAAADELLRYCIAIGGTITGEHGVGLEKVGLMAVQFDAATMGQFERLRRAFGGGDGFNPGKLMPSADVRFTPAHPGRQAPQ